MGKGTASWLSRWLATWQSQKQWHCCRRILPEQRAGRIQWLFQQVSTSINAIHSKEDYGRHLPSRTCGRCDLTHNSHCLASGTQCDKLLPPQPLVLYVPYPHPIMISVQKGNKSKGKIKMPCQFSLYRRKELFPEGQTRSYNGTQNK